MTDFHNTKKLLQNFYKNCKFMKHVLATIEVTLSIFYNDLPTKVPTKNGKSGTPITGEEMLMNQLGRKGVMRKNIM